MTKTRGAIAAGHAKTAEAGVEMFNLGGNVFDAVAAAVFASCVAEPALTSIAGGGFLLAHTADHHNILFDFFTQTPHSKRPLAEVDFYPVDVDFGTTTQEFHIGMGAIAVPGTLAGLYHVQQRLGRLPFATVLEPAIHYAQTGVEVSDFQAYCFQILSPIWLASPETRDAIAPQGRLIKTGDRLIIPNLATTLQQIAQDGPALLYQGELGQQLINDCAKRGGYLTRGDLQHYRVIERQPLTTEYRGTTFLTNPPPSSGGALIAFALALLASDDLTALSYGSVAHLTRLAEVMRLTNLARRDGYDERLYESDVAQRFLSASHLNTYIQQLQPLAASVNKWGSTTHVSAIDAEGNAASVTSSNGEGCGYVIPGSGVMVNNMLGEADLHPAGFHQWQEDVRISSMMSPTMVLQDGRPEIVLGSGGSNRIRTAILQVISNIVDFQMPIDAAVNAGRVHWENDVFNLEPGFDPSVINTTGFPFDGQVMQWEQQNMFFGGVHTVMTTTEGEIVAVGDRRRAGAVAYAR